MKVDYEISFPDAQGMIEQERKAQNDVPQWFKNEMADAFKNGMVAPRVSQVIWDQYFGFEGSPSHLEKLMEVLVEFSNSPEWQAGALRWMARQCTRYAKTAGYAYSCMPTDYEGNRYFPKPGHMKVTFERIRCPIHNEYLKKDTGLCHTCWDEAKERGKEDLWREAQWASPDGGIPARSRIRWS